MVEVMNDQLRTLRRRDFVVDECGCAKPQDIAIPMMATSNLLTRIVLAGDSRQLPPLIFTKSAQKIWATSILAGLTGRGHTTTRLNIEYRCHSNLYAPTSQVSYEAISRLLGEKQNLVSLRTQT